jgi:hypothetical protein
MGDANLIRLDVNAETLEEPELGERFATDLEGAVGRVDREVRDADTSFGVHQLPV